MLYEAALAEEAERLRVEVTPADARRRLAQLKSSAGSRKGFGRSLGGQGERELVAQLRRQLLAEKVSEEARESGERGSVIREVQMRWSAQTVCRPGIVVAACVSQSSARK